MNNFVNKIGAERHLRYEEGAPMPSGTVVAKDSFVVNPDDSVAGTTNGAGSATVEFCNACHVNVAEDQDYPFFLPEDMRVKR